ncbi:MAG TPA: penicillin-binding protein 2, partial [Streptosporangiaceae bacterium]|nr:penicillin-binding protein 2 [Streptosporangiaceae bacterium]
GRGGPGGNARRAGGPGGPGGARRPAGARLRTSAARMAPARARAILRRRNPRHRLNATLLVIAVILSLFAGRLVQMQGLEWAHYRTLAQKQRTDKIPIPTLRGSITTSDGQILAMTRETDTVIADPKLMKTPAQRQHVALALASPLQMSPADIADLLDHPSSPEYQVLKKGISSADARRISKLELPGITLDPSYARSYPDGTLAANLVGFTTVNSDGDLAGAAGLESRYNRLLAGRDGSQEVEQSATGVQIPLTQAKVDPPVPARNLRLTIQSSIQYEADRQCRLQVAIAKARNCSIVVMQPGTGKILAMAQYPTYNPNMPVPSLDKTRNIAVANVFAPGSTLKPMTVAAALERGGQTPESTYTVPDQITVQGFHFHDAEPHPTAKYTINGILANSLNDGMVQIVQSITPQQQYDYLRAFGLGQVSGLDLPGESPGLVIKPGTRNYWLNEPYEMSFGQGIGVTAIQMASAYAAIANGGVRVQPSIVAGTTSAAGTFTRAPKPSSKRVIQASTARALMAMMEQVPRVDARQGVPWGMIAGYPVASKTGTAQVSDGGKCGLCQYGSSYIGIAPAQSPKLVVAVNIQDPTAHGYYGDEIAGPVFYHVMKFALQTLKIPPTHAQAPHIRLMQP